MRLSSLSLIAVCLVAAAAAGRARVSNEDLTSQVMAHERAFAATMAARDFEGFGRYLSREAVFMTGSDALRGKEAVLAAWRRHYDGGEPPFSWEPKQVEVVASGTLAYSTGPIRDAQGRRIGSFNSVWRLEAPGRWAVVFDRGCDCRQ
ncbi:YybH family protein [Telluria beijingensis]|uniref:YybH family protein n=1 Tax=Telluria beijingensis TaxID=3068633 RepID=UPI0027953FE5|nr:nuclear transport factor 2 family protein [Massilia sp. REN29]